MTAGDKISSSSSSDPFRSRIADSLGSLRPFAGDGSSPTASFPLALSLRHSVPLRPLPVAGTVLSPVPCDVDLPFFAFVASIAPHGEREPVPVGWVGSVSSGFRLPFFVVMARSWGWKATTGFPVALLMPKTRGVRSRHWLQTRVWGRHKKEAGDEGTKSDAGADNEEEGGGVCV